MNPFTRLLFLLLVALLGGVNSSMAQLNADFVADTTKGCGSISGLNFTDQSTGNPTSWQWDFGNGNTSTMQNPNVNYTSPGKNTVQLIVNNASSSDTIVKNNLIQVFRNPNADYSFSPSSGCAPLKVQFNDASTNGDTAISIYVWDFGDGGKGSAKNLSHTYQVGGNFPTSLQITDHNGCTDFVTKPALNITNPPQALFSSQRNPWFCEDTLTVSFVNNSKGNNLSYQWDFGDGNTSTQANPTHFYSGFGDYDVRLIVNGLNCSDTLEIKSFVRLAQLKADFTVQKKEFCFGDSIAFINQSTGATRYRWNFGDGSSSTLKNPTKVYQDSGFFVVELITSLGTACIETHTDTIHVQQVIADFVSEPNIICKKDTATIFTNRSVNSDTSIWSFSTSYKYPYIDTTTNDSMVELDYNQLDVIEFENGFFSDTLIAISRRGCQDTLVKDSNRRVSVFSVRINLKDSPKHRAFESNKKKVIGGCGPLNYDFEGITNYFKAADTLIWDFDNGSVSNLTDPPPFTISDDSLRKVVLTGRVAEGCSFGDTLLIQVGNKQNPDFTFLNDSVCWNESLSIFDQSSDTNQIDRIAASLFRRNFSDSLFYTSNISKLSFENLDRSGIYSIRYSVFDNGCETSIIRDSLFTALGPFASFFPKSPLNCANRRRIQFNSTFDQVTDFVWDFGDGSPKDSVNENPVHLYNSDRTYTVTLKVFNDTTGCDTLTKEIKLPIRPLPKPPIGYKPKNYCLGDSLLMITFPTGFDTLEWKFNGKVIEPNSDSVLVFPDKIGFNIIELRGVDFIGCEVISKDTIYLSHINAAIDSNIIEPCLPFNGIYTDASITDTTIKEWFWEIEKDSIFNDSAILTFNTPGNRDLFYRVENTLGCKDSFEIKDFVQVQDMDVDFIFGNNFICEGESVTFRNNSNSTGNPIFTWFFGDGDSLVSQNEFVNHRFDSSGRFTITLKGVLPPDGCEKIEAKKDLVIVEPSPEVDFTADTTQADCYPLAVNFSNLSKGNIASWDWRFGNGGSSILENPFVNYTSPGSFDVFLRVTTQNGCADSILKPGFIQTDGPTAEFSFSKDSLCINEPLRFAITSKEDVASFLWDFGDGSVDSGEVVTHAYQRTGKIFPSLILRDSSGSCTVVLRDSVFVFEVEADFSVNPDTACAPFTAGFRNQSRGANSFLWRFPDGQSNSNDNTPELFFDQAGSFEVSLEVSSSIGCRDEITKTILVHPKPLASVSEDKSICFGDTVLLQAKGGVQYQWSPITGLSSGTDEAVLAFPDSTTLYQVIVTNRENCRDTARVEVNVQQAPADFSLNDTNIIIGEEVALDVFSGVGFIYRWTPSEGLSCDDCPRPIAQPLSSQLFTLFLEDSTGCYELRDSIFIEVKEVFSLDVPTAFTPNDDGVNDVIYARGWGLKELIAFKIYNRFGELVFESNDFDHGWDGTFRGQAQNMETYIYTVEALTFSGKVLTKKGNISLLR